MVVTVPAGSSRPERMSRILARDGAACVWCALPLAPGDRRLTFEHVVPKLKGGPAWAENEVPACGSCNRARGHTAPSVWLGECEARGLRARRHVIERSLLALREAIEQRGGQRRARPYLARELRRLGLS